jgi:uncharacterized protein (DUF697 family)/uncharacterized tellurite resistance protein B-like protein
VEALYEPKSARSGIRCIDSKQAAEDCEAQQFRHIRSVNQIEKESIALIALSAAFCDGNKTDSEREAVRTLLEDLEIPNASALVTRVLLKKASLVETTPQLLSPESRVLAYEMAVSIIEADGHRNEVETQFLAELASLLQLLPQQAAEPLKVADNIAASASLPPLLFMPEPTSTGPAIPANATAAPTTPVRTPDPVLASTIRNTAILAGALELLPQSVATLGILPLQTHLVYRVGRHYGYTLDAGHVKEFIGVLGLGLTSQALEGLARKFLGGLIKKAGGGLAGSLAKAATGPAITFATTYAMGQLAQRYYMGGRTLSTLQLKDSFQQLFSAARSEGERLLPEIQSRAKGLNLSQLPALIRGV